MSRSLQISRYIVMLKNDYIIWCYWNTGKYLEVLINCFCSLFGLKHNIFDEIDMLIWVRALLQINVIPVKPPNCLLSYIALTTSIQSIKYLHLEAINNRLHDDIKEPKKIILNYLPFTIGVDKSGVCSLCPLFVFCEYWSYHGTIKT